MSLECLGCELRLVSSHLYCVCECVCVSLCVRSKRRRVVNTESSFRGLKLLPAHEHLWELDTPIAVVNGITWPMCGSTMAKRWGCSYWLYPECLLPLAWELSRDVEAAWWQWQSPQKVGEMLGQQLGFPPTQFSGTEWEWEHPRRHGNLLTLRWLLHQDGQHMWMVNLKRALPGYFSKVH